MRSDVNGTANSDERQFAVHGQCWPGGQRLSLTVACLVFDLPQPYQKPCLEKILSALDTLKLAPPSWDEHASSGSTLSRIDPHGVTDYLTSFVSSSLAWLPADDDRERVWDAASGRLAERAGRTGMGALERVFSLPTWPEDVADETTCDGTTDLILHEPALTSDNLGHKTWASAYILARKHELLGPIHRMILSHGQKYEILELGSGTGLVGITLATMLGASVLLTDLPDIVQNLSGNVTANSVNIAARGGTARVAALDWREPELVQPVKSEAAGRALSCRLETPLIVAADPIYDPEQPSWLAQTIGLHLARAPEARAVVTIAVREAFGKERADFSARMVDQGLSLYSQDFDQGFDDWGSAHDDSRAAVECWTSIWMWKALMR